MFNLTLEATVHPNPHNNEHMQANVKKCERLPEQLFNIVQVIDANDEGRDVNECK